MPKQIQAARYNGILFWSDYFFFFFLSDDYSYIDEIIIDEQVPFNIQDNSPMYFSKNPERSGENIDIDYVQICPIATNALKKVM